MQWSYCLSFVSSQAREQNAQYPSPGDKLNDRDGARLKHVLWDMIMERILVPGSEQANVMDQGWPERDPRSRAVLEAQKPVPYDPDGYLKALKADLNSVNDAVLEYLAEALGTFRTGNNLAAAVMLCAASEMVFNELCSAIPPVMADQPARDKLVEKLTKGKMKDRINTIVGWCRNQQNPSPRIMVR